MSFIMPPNVSTPSELPHRLGGSAGVTANSPQLACFFPLIAVSNPEHAIKQMPGCGVPCRDELAYTRAEKDNVQWLILILAGSSAILTAFTLVSGIIDRQQRRFPGVLLLYINACQLVASIGWLYPYYANGKDLVCRSDGTLINKAPREWGDSRCAVIFVLIYYFTLAAHTWFVFLAVAWNISFRHIGKPRKKTNNKRLALFHVIAWTLPAIIVAASLSITELDGLWMAQTCHLSIIRDSTIRILLLVVPDGAASLLGGIFMLKGAVALERLRRNQSSTLSQHSSARIKQGAIRIGFFGLLFLIFITLTMAVHIYELTQKHKWIDGYSQYLICRGKEVFIAVQTHQSNTADVFSGKVSSCRVNERASLLVIYLGFIAQLFIGIAAGAWGLNRSSVSSWKNLFCSLWAILTCRHGAAEISGPSRHENHPSQRENGQLNPGKDEGYSSRAPDMSVSGAHSHHLASDDNATGGGYIHQNSAHVFSACSGLSVVNNQALELEVISTNEEEVQRESFAV